ncbi:MAG: flavin reductase family protein, partial [Pseudonocardiaceae bacterium]
MAAIDPRGFRQTLGSYPTGVVVVTGGGGDAQAGLAVGSFSSVSRDPPLVGFLPDEQSTSWRNIHEGGCFCVNILA